MSDVIIVAALSLIGTLAGAFGGIMASNKLTNHRLLELEKKVDKLGGVVERMALAEKDISVANHRIADLEEATR